MRRDRSTETTVGLQMLNLMALDPTIATNKDKHNKAKKAEEVARADQYGPETRLARAFTRSERRDSFSRLARYEGAR